MLAVGSTVILPGVVPHFFTGAAAGVFGNTTGGIKGSIAGSFVNGVIVSFLPLLLMPVLGDLGFASTTFSDADFGVSGLFFGTLANYAGPFAIVASLIVILVLMAIPFKKKTAEVKAK